MQMQHPDRGRGVIAFFCLLILAGCSDTASAPIEAPASHVTKQWDATASVYWNDVARDLVVASGANAFQAIRGYALVSAAQYNAAVTAEKAKQRDIHASVRASVAAASATVLSYLHPSSATEIEATLDAFLTEPGWPGDAHRNVAAGAAVGRDIAMGVIARAQSDNFFAPWSGTVPTGPGLWSSSAPPIGVLFGQARTYFLASGDQFRPPAPPEFGSTAFDAALAEVRHYSDTRTAEQDASAKLWALPAGTHAPSGYWNEVAAQLAVRYHMSERRAAHLFALMNMVGFDAIVAAHDAKYAYWTIRPSQADPGISLAVGLPNFPSYPSNHAALSAGMARILGAVFPAEQNRLDALAEEAALSRLYAGIHYRFDNDVGLDLGRQIAALALSLDVRGHEPFPLD
jgi:hypothetical protein